MGPLLRAAGTPSSGLERIPDMTAAGIATPGILRFRLPLALRAADAAAPQVELVDDFLVWCDDEGENRHAASTLRRSGRIG